MSADEHDDLPSNRADFSNCETLDEKRATHRENVEDTIDRAKDGEPVNLTDLMKDAEEIHIDAVEQRGGR